ncbi:anucleate primary sterigmata (ApsB), putative [Talaromyces stipitatus ATCC 10500]|uniref:Anucleate primary sterigmata (ApsB), putative n=1 Tax=Talaromyces stipitatus (strain ATCC 10500 / CBS 375.48 / QM 6759 / NRRL 1006) TaxID=441959 RepID=B8MNP2_TALSN|nr:anucleate primary sterigmata (ApsB), putative [Talaromyces stipitatus ATCC 10500]EED14131.1 anucleate primary sterigmata (ApsB), putative [Talaromyces stipitatus ATCC 10500]
MEEEQQTTDHHHGDEAMMSLQNTSHETNVSSIAANEVSRTQEGNEEYSELPPPNDPNADDSRTDESILHHSLDIDHEDEDDNDAHRPNNQTILEEKEMRRKLQDIESSFLPEPSTIEMARTENLGADDTYLVGVPMENREHEEEVSYNPDMSRIQEESSITELPRIVTHDETGEQIYHVDPTTTPATDRESELNTSALETLNSSPTAAAAERTISRALSNVSRNAQDSAFEDSADLHRSLTPRKSRRNLSPALSDTRRSREAFVDSNEEDSKLAGSQADRKRSRPKYLSSRQSSHRYSASSITSTNTETTTSEATLGADYALQSGGAVPSRGSTGRKDLSRTISLGSMASGVSALSEENVLDRRVLSGATDGGLHTLDEEDPGSIHPKDLDENVPVTPRAGSRDLNLPMDTVVAQHVQDIQVPGTFAREFHAKFSTNSMSPDRRPGAPTPAFGRSGKSMTLKEQSSTIDRLSKENFDLKMRIHFLNEALNKRSEEGIKEMVSENVELKSDNIKLQKEIQGMKRTIRNLEKQLKDSQSSKDAGGDTEVETSEDDKRNDVEEEELIYLRERIETYQVEIERLRSESIVRESEKRRLAEIVKSMGENRPTDSEAGAREERGMWKDMLDAETAAREQAEEENRKLRDELMRMREGNTTGSEAGRFGRTVRKGSFISHSTTSERDHDRRLTVPSSTSSTLLEIELLKKENAELRREVSVQTSMLTSRNREKERLYQEIEDLKLQRRDGGRSVAGDSIFERSASRAHARSSSRASNGTRESRMSDTERESLEVRNGELRDQVSALKLENQSLRSQLDEYIAEYEALDKAYQADVDQADEDMQMLQQERDQALQVAEHRALELQDLKEEAQEEIDTLGDELDQKVDECNRMEMTLRTQEENLKTLQAEMRSASEGILRLEEDAQSNLRKFKQVQQELEDSNREIESLEKSLFEANGKVQRLTVQIESSQGEITFLREEQDADKIRISELDSELKTYQVNLQVEKEKAKELETRLAEERHQREVVGSKEKQEVQRIMNDLNREASAAKDEIRRLKKTLSTREIEAATWKERLMELENGLREALGDLNGTRSSLLNSIIKLQKELESKSLDLESTRSKLDEKESLLQSREALLESHGLESRKLADLLDRERHARRADKNSFDQALKSQQQASRTISQHNSRISDLESARNQDRKRFASLEQQLKDQLSERNALFLTLWKRLSAMCGPDWAHSNSLINGNLPSVEVIGNILFWPGFSRNLLLSVKTVENMLSGFKTRIRTIERDLTKEYQSLEHNFGIRVKKLERLEEAVRNIRSQQRAAAVSPEVTKLRGEVRFLKAELNLMQSNPSSRRTGSNLSHATTAVEQDPLPSPTRTQSTLVRSDSRSKKGTVSRGSGTTLVETSSTSTSSQRNTRDSEQDNVMIQRLRELERRLKSERVARLADRDGARKRLEERDAENEELRAELERERMRRSARGALEAPSASLGRSNSSRKTSRTLVVESGPPTSSGEDDKRTFGSDNEDTDAHSSYGEGITVDIEM